MRAKVELRFDRYCTEFIYKSGEGIVSAYSKRAVAQSAMSQRRNVRWGALSKKETLRIGVRDVRIRITCVS